MNQGTITADIDAVEALQAVGLNPIILDTPEAVARLQRKPITAQGILENARIERIKQDKADKLKAAQHKAETYRKAIIAMYQKENGRDYRQDEMQDEIKDWIKTGKTDNQALRRFIHQIRHALKPDDRRPDSLIAQYKHCTRPAQSAQTHTIYRHFIAALPWLTLMLSPSRLNNTYCRDNRNDNSRSRYKMINYHSVREHGTIEIRAHQGTIDADKIRAWFVIFLELKKTRRIVDTLKKAITGNLLSPETQAYVERRILHFHPEMKNEIDLIRRAAVTCQTRNLI